MLGSQYLVDLGAPHALGAVKVKRRVVPVFDDVRAFLDGAGAAFVNVGFVGLRIGGLALALSMRCILKMIEGSDAR